MIYLVYGEENYLIDKYIEAEISRKKIELVNKYEYPATSISSFITDASYNDLFSSKKAIIVYNATFLTSKAEEKEILLDYLNNPNENTFLFFVINTSKVDETSDIISKIKESGYVRSFLKSRETDINKFISSYLKENGLTIDARSISEIINRVGTDYFMLTNELDKLILYKDDDKNVTIKDVTDVVSISLENDVFKLINGVTDKNLKKLISYYNDLVNLGNHPSMILTLIANQFRLIYQVKVLSREGKSESEISKLIGAHPYQVKLANAKTLLFSESELINIIHKLALLDEDIKLGRVEIENSLEEFFIYVCK